MNVKNLFTRAAVVAAFSLPSLAVLAEEAGEGGSDASASLGSQVVSSAQGTLTTVLTAAGPAILAIIGAGLALWAGISIVGILKRAFSAGKGR